ncbi:MAG TPA: ATP-binding protein [Steroidobacteraceae bacterium]|nr:ATP-binding protein [Steroidobacteraceae bacterium]
MRLPALSIERHTLLGFGAAVALLALLSLTAVQAARSWAKSAGLVAHTYEVISELEGLSGSLNIAEAARRGFLATGQSSYLQERNAVLGRLQAHLLVVRQLTIDNSTQQLRIRRLQMRLATRGAEVDALIAIAQQQGLGAAQKALAAQDAQQATAEANRLVEEMEQAERALLATRSAADERSARLLALTFGALLLSIAGVLGWVFVRIRRDMRQNTRQAEELQGANSALEAANRELESFSYSVSHDLRSPLRAIDGFAQMLDEDYGATLDETGRRYIRVVREGSQRMASLIDDLLAFSRLSRQSLARMPVDMASLARRVAAEAVEGAPGATPTLLIEDLPSVQGDPALLRQVWANLIGNAVKYSARSTQPRVRIRAMRDGDAVRYEVEDNGVGFDMQYVNKLFGVFQRLHRPEEYPGTGVGLAIVQRIVARHGGTVTARGACGKGATFGFTLPLEVKP